MSTARPVAYLLIALLFAETSGASALRHLSSLSLPDGMTARDVRWASPSDVYLAAGREGIVRVRLDGSPARGKTVTAAEGVRSPIAGMVGAGNAHVLYGSQLGEVGWVPLTGAGKAGDKGLLTVVDLDAWNDTAVILGADSGPVQGLARDGAIAWVGSFSKNLTDLRPIMKGRSKPGGKDMARCGILETGRARFMRDGSVVIAPGVEPGLFRYDRDGKLLQTWDSEPLGIIDDCWIAEKDLLLLARDFAARIDWYASRVIVDDILPLADGPALVLRRVERGVTKWDLVTLPYRGKSQRIPLPLTLPNPRGHLRGDVRGDEVVLLLFEDPLPGQKAQTPPKLVRMTLVR